MLGQCWATVADGGPTLTQHFGNVSCLLVGHCHIAGVLGKTIYSHAVSAEEMNMTKATSRRHLTGLHTLCTRKNKHDVNSTNSAKSKTRINCNPARSGAIIQGR